MYLVTFHHCNLRSKVAEDLLSLVPVHRRRSLLAAAGESLLFSLSSCGTQTQAAVHERVRNTPVVLIRDLHTHKRTCFRHTLTNDSFSVLFLTLFLSHLLSHLDAHVRAADFWLGGGTSWGLRCWAPIVPGFWRRVCDWGVCQCDVYNWWICGWEVSGRRGGGWGAICGWFIHIDLCERGKRNKWDIWPGE